MPRNRWNRIATTVCAMLAVLLLAASWRFVESRGVFTSVKEVTQHVCRQPDRTGQGGVADIAVDAAGKTAYLAMADALFALPIGMNDAPPVKLSGTPKDFHPVALSPARGSDGAAKLWAIFTGRDGRYAIALFDVLPGALKEIGRLTTDVLSDPADLAAIDANRFYLVNRHTSRTAFGRWLDDAFLLPRAEVLYYDGMKFVTVAERLNSPSGIAVSPDKSHLYVSEDYPHTIASFTRNEFTGALDNPALISVPAGPLKIRAMDDGSLIVAAWPKGSTGAVYKVRIANGVLQPPELLYAAKGESVTAVAEANGHLLIGSDKQLLDCRL